MDPRGKASVVEQLPELHDGEYSSLPVHFFVRLHGGQWIPEDFTQGGEEVETGVHAVPRHVDGRRRDTVGGKAGHPLVEIFESQRPNASALERWLHVLVDDVAHDLAVGPADRPATGELPAYILGVVEVQEVEEEGDELFLLAFPEVLFRGYRAGVDLLDCPVFGGAFGALATRTRGGMRAVWQVKGNVVLYILGVHSFAAKKLEGLLRPRHARPPSVFVGFTIENQSINQRMGSENQTQNNW